jgi:hypothetical protein
MYTNLHMEYRSIMVAIIAFASLGWERSATHLKI